MSGFGEPTVISDAAKRLSDEYLLHRTALGYAAIGQWFVVRMDTGESTDNHTLYASKRAAVWHHRNDVAPMIYTKIRPFGMTPQMAQGWLSFCRKHYDAGWGLPDPDSRTGPEPIVRLTREAQRENIRALLGRRFPRER